jgi:hypothetical protein
MFAVTSKTDTSFESVFHNDAKRVNPERVKETT